MRYHKGIWGGLLVLFLLAGCSSATDPAANNSNNGSNGGNSGDGPFIITDRTGKRWDVTHAVKRYNFEADKFQFGLGPNAIPPIEEPRFFSPEDPGWPGPEQTFIVIGANINGHTRAYPTTILKSFEVVDDQFGEDYLAVTY